MTVIEFGPNTLAAINNLADALRGAASKPAAPTAAAPAKPYTGSLPTNFPNYGRSKGAPIEGATREDLDYYASGARRSIADPAKARWADKERALLAAIDAEIARQEGGDVVDLPAADAPVGGGSVTGGFPETSGDIDVPFMMLEMRLDRP